MTAAGSRSATAAPRPPTSKTASAPDERDFVISRVIDAPRDLVFKAWTDPKHLARWWGPKGFTNRVDEVDVRPGGAYRVVMISPEGVEYPLRGVYREVVKPERLVMTDVWDEHPAEWKEQLKKNLPKGEDEPVQEALNTVTFEDRDGKTKLTIRTRFASAAVRDAMVKMGMNEGWGESLDRLEEHVANV